jgi:hypothetical protein
MNEFEEDKFECLQEKKVLIDELAAYLAHNTETRPYKSGLYFPCFHNLGEKKKKLQSIGVSGIVQARDELLAATYGVDFPETTVLYFFEKVQTLKTIEVENELQWELPRRQSAILQRRKVDLQRIFVQAQEEDDEVMRRIKV